MNYLAVLAKLSIFLFCSKVISTVRRNNSLSRIQQKVPFRDRIHINYRGCSSSSVFIPQTTRSHNGCSVVPLLLFYCFNFFSLFVYPQLYAHYDQQSFPLSLTGRSFRRVPFSQLRHHLSARLVIGFPRIPFLFFSPLFFFFLHARSPRTIAPRRVPCSSFFLFFSTGRKSSVLFA